MTICSSPGRSREMTPRVPHAWFVSVGLVLSGSLLPAARRVPSKKCGLTFQPNHVLLLDNLLLLC